METNIKNLFLVHWNMYVKYRDFAFQGFYHAKMKKWENGEDPQTGSNSKGEANAYEKEATIMHQ